jgi:hypothetical protein
LLQYCSYYSNPRGVMEAVTRNLKLEVSGTRTQWPPGHMARLTGQHLVCYRLNQGSNSSLDPYK